MNRRSLAALLALAGLTAAARADSATLVVVESADPDRNEIVTEVIVCTQVVVKKTVTVNVNGKLESRLVDATEVVSKKVKQAISIRNFTAYTGAGRKLDAAEAMKRLKPGSVVVLGPPELADKKYAGVFRPGTVLLLSKGPGPNSVAPVPGGPPPAKLPARPAPVPKT